MTKIQFELDGKMVEAQPGESIWQVAKREGTEIPHLCYSPEPDYRADGNCRACMVEIEGERARRLRPQDGDGASGRRPAGARDIARSRLLVLELGRQGQRH